MGDGVIKGIYRSSPPTVSDNQAGALLIDANGRLVTTVAGITAAMEGEYNSSPVTVVDGATEELQIDVNGRVLTVPYGVYNSSAPTMVDAAKGVLQLDVNGNIKAADQFAPQAEDNTNGVYAVVRKPLATSTYAFTSAANLGAATKACAKASAGTVYRISTHNVNAAARWLQLHNKASAPAGADVPVWSVPVPLSVGFVDITFPDGIYLSTGVSWAISTTMATFTDSATANEHNIFIQYK